MADFCNKCAHELWGEDFEPEIDVSKIANQLPTGHYISVLCEGCVMVAISKDETGKVNIAYGNIGGDDLTWGSFEDWEAKDSSLKIK